MIVRCLTPGFGLLLGLAFSAPAPVRAAAPDPVADASSGQVPAPGTLVFFPIDEVSIPWRANLKVTLEAPKKYEANPVFRAGPPAAPDGFGAILYGTVIKDGGKLRMWYLATPRGEHAELMGHFARPLAYAESQDGIHWTRPDLGLVEFRGNKHNNLPLVEPESEPYAMVRDFVAVILDPSDPDPSRRYKMSYITRDVPLRSESAATAVSPDGLRWQLINRSMITRGHFENTGLVKFDGLYYMTGQNVPPYDANLLDGSPAGRLMKVFFSPDFSHWSEGRAMSFYRRDYQPRPLHIGQETHMGAGVWNRGNVILGLYGAWHGDTIVKAPSPTKPLPDDGLLGLTTDLGLVVSNDAIHYREPVPGFVMVHHGTDAEWDARAVLQANAMANVGDETLIWYSNWNTSRSDGAPPIARKLSAETQLRMFAVGMARMPRDRFGYFSKSLPTTVEEGPAASCLTRSIRLDRPSRLYANVASVSATRPLEIALVDDAERPLAGYTAKLTRDAFKEPIEWAGGLQELPAGVPFRVKAIWAANVDQAKLYALYVDAE